MDLEKKIDQYLQKNEKEIVDSLCSLVQIPSIAVRDDPQYPYGKACAAAMDFCKNLAEKKGLVTVNHEYRCIEAAIAPAETLPAGAKRLVIASHGDVVDVDDDDTYPPFAAQKVGDYVVGRGSVDDKGPLIATLYAAAFLKESGIPLKSDVRLVFGSNEEQGMDDMEYYLAKEGQPDLGLAVDDDFPVVNGEKGLLRFTLSAPAAPGLTVESQVKTQRLTPNIFTMKQGQEKHCFNREEHQNPVAQAVLHWDQAGKALFAREQHTKTAAQLAGDSLGEQLQVYAKDEKSGESLLRLYGAKTENNILSLFFDLRLPVTASLEQAKERIRAFACREGFQLEFTKESPGYFVPEEDEMVRLLTSLYNSTVGAKDKPYVMGACTYARMFRRGMGFGAGDPHEVKPFPKGHGAAHGPDEAHNIPVLLRAVKLYILGILAIDQNWSQQP